MGHLLWSRQIFWVMSRIRFSQKMALASMESFHSRTANSWRHSQSECGPNQPQAIGFPRGRQKCQFAGQNKSYTDSGSNPAAQRARSGCLCGVGRVILRFAAIQVPLYSKILVSWRTPADGLRKCSWTMPLFPSAPTSQVAWSWLGVLVLLR